MLRRGLPLGVRPALGIPTYLFEIVQAVLVTVGDVEGVEVLQGTSLIRQPHSGDAFQDLIQLLLTRGLKRAQKAENKTNKKKIRAMGLFNVNTLDNRNTSRDEHLCTPPYDPGWSPSPTADFTCRHPKIRALHIHTCRRVEIHIGTSLPHASPGREPS